MQAKFLRERIDRDQSGFEVVCCWPGRAEGASEAPACRLLETTAMTSRRWLTLAGFVAACLAAGAVGGWATASSVADWYTTLRKPWFTPPSSVFGPVWTLLYILMGIAAWLVWETGERRAMLAFAAQLALNLVWSLLFFGARSPGLALIDIALLWLAIVVTIVMFARARPLAGWLMVPYLAWVSFAAALNAAIWRLN